MGVSRTFQEFSPDAFRDEIVTLFFSLLCFNFLPSKSLSYRNTASSVECILMEQIWYTGRSGQDRREQKTYFGMKTGRN
jgi:hypothetical protein